MLGQLKKGQSVLIHAGASGVGEATMMCSNPVRLLVPCPAHGLVLLHFASAWWASTQALLSNAVLHGGRTSPPQ